MQAFKENNQYEVRFIGDSALRPVVTIVKRTAKTVVVDGRGIDNKRCKIHTYRGEEFIYPFGSYSMAPTVSADNEA